MHLDVRIFVKEARTLAEAGHEVHVMAPGDPPPPSHGVTLHRLPGYEPDPLVLPWRVWRGLPAMYRAARELRGDAYHLTDPLLIPLGLMLQRDGGRIVYDAHEDRPRHALYKYGSLGRPLLARGISVLWWALESIARRRFDRFVAATPQIASKYPPQRTRTLFNYPLSSEQAETRAAAPPYRDRPPVIVYAGMLTSTRGIDAAVKAMGLLPPELGARLALVGDFARAHPGFARHLESLPGWSSVDLMGWMSRSDMARVVASSRAAVTLFTSEPIYRDAIGNKTFEYMALGVPVVAPDFPIWNRVVRDGGAGLTTDVTDPVALAGVLRALLEDPERGEAMARRGPELIEERYSWELQGAPGIRALYEELATGGTAQA